MGETGPHRKQRCAPPGLRPEAAQVTPEVDHFPDCSPVSSQEAQTWRADFVIEDDHGEDATGGRSAALDGDVPPLLLHAARLRLLALQGQAEVQETGLATWETAAGLKEPPPNSRAARARLTFAQLADWFGLGAVRGSEVVGKQVGDVAGQTKDSRCETVLPLAVVGG